MPFRGIYEHTLDDRGRVALPARYRHEFAEGGVATMSPDGCVQVFTPAGFELMSEEGASETALSRDGRRARRRFDSHSFDVDLDRQGRVLVPVKFRDSAGLDGPVVIAGARECLEIWNPQRWEKELEASTEASSSGQAAGE